MSKNYIILDIKTNGDFEPDNKSKITSIYALKIDNNMNNLDYVQFDIKSNEKENIKYFIKFCSNSNIIIYNAKNTLSFILKMLYQNKIYDDFRFKYIDIINIFKDDINKTFGDVYNIKKILRNYLTKNNIDNLDKLLCLQPNHGLIFRGLNYPKYLCDVMIDNNKYYGYIVDLSDNKYISYYSCLKEINSEYFNIDEIKMLRSLGAIIIINVMYLCEEVLMITDYYSIIIGNNYEISGECKNFLDSINKYIEYKKNNKKLKLVLWGSITKLEEIYNSFDIKFRNYYSQFIDTIKEPWDYWDKE